MKFLVLADDDGVRHDLTTQDADLLLSLGDVADLVILEAVDTNSPVQGMNSQDTADHFVHVDEAPDEAGSARRASDDSGRLGGQASVYATA